MGLAQGFETFFDNFDFSRSRGISLSMSRPGNEVVDSALTWLEGHAGSRFFAWVHLYDPHTPYAPPEPFKTQYAGRPYVAKSRSSIHRSVVCSPFSNTVC